jgi:di/tripeptidase
LLSAFTPDEEIGQGADGFDVTGFGADFAYTVDGGPVESLNMRPFNAAIAHIDNQDINVHPGTAPYAHAECNAGRHGIEQHVAGKSTSQI